MDGKDGKDGKGMERSLLRDFFWNIKEKKKSQERLALPLFCWGIPFLPCW
ncbi:hypothetical protein ACRALDRAFT_211740 [Sodiomyces alcalophilus JCM 7366]